MLYLFIENFKNGIEIIMMRLNTLIFHNKIMKKIKHKKCKGCKYLFDKGDLLYCTKSNIYIEPLHYFCKHKSTIKTPEELRREFLLRRENDGI